MTLETTQSSAKNTLNAERAEVRRGDRSPFGILGESSAVLSGQNVWFILSFRFTKFPEDPFFLHPSAYRLARTASITRSTCSSVSSGNIGRLTTSRAAISVSRRLPAC